MPQTPIPLQLLPFPVRSVPFPALLLDRAMPRLTDTEWRLLCVIVRQTLGWQQPARGDTAEIGNREAGRKERDWLTQGQLAARTGRSSKPLSRAISGLVAKGFIQVLTDQGKPLDTPQERRRYPNKHWYRLHPQWTAGLADSERASGQRNGLPRQGDADQGTFGEGPYASDAKTSEAETSAYGLLSAGNGLDADGACGVSPVEKGHTTKESRNKRNIVLTSFSERETLTGSLSGEVVDSVLLSGETPHEETPHAPELATSAGGILLQESLRHPGNLPTEPGYLRQIVKDGTVNYNDVRRFLLNYRDGYRKVFPKQEPPSVAWAREGRIVAGLLRQHSYEHLLQLLNRFLSHPDPRRRGYSLAAFSAAIAGLLAHEQKEDEQRGANRRHPRTDTDYPIRLWQENEVVTVRGSAGKVAGRAWERPDTAQKTSQGALSGLAGTIAANRPAEINEADDPHRHWSWRKHAGRWEQDQEGLQRPQPPVGQLPSEDQLQMKTPLNQDKQHPNNRGAE